MSNRPPHQYRDLEPEQQESLLSNFLVSSWSYSKVASFARNQLAFEMAYIFGIYGKSGPTSIAGNAYHAALQVYFTQIMDGVHVQLPELDAIAFQYLEQVPANRWKLGKTSPTMEKAMETALKTSNKLLLNFYSEREVYENDISEVLAVEFYFSEWLTINGVDIPLPCNGLIDMVVRTREGKIAVVDHKSKTAYTDAKEAALAIGPQAIIYAKAYEAKTGTPVDQVWFVENKSSQNSDKTAQVKPIKVDLDPNTRKLYELLLYGNLRQMIAAVKDPDHIYTVNLDDNYVDMAELMDFWTRVQICDVEDFNVEESKKELVAKRIKKTRDASVEMIPPSVIKAFREKAASFIQYDYSVLNMTPKEKIVHVLRSFGINLDVAHSFEGYSSNTFLLSIGAGVKVDSIKKYRMDIANALDVPSVRIGRDLKVHEGKSYLSIEVSKAEKRTLAYNPSDRQGFKIPLGRDNYDNVIVWDLDNQSTPHMLVGGATGSGKSVFLDALLEYAIEAGVEDIIILDPKYEFGHLEGPGIDVFNDILQIEEVMAKLVKQMNDRVFKKINKKCLIVFDEYADAIARARKPQALKTYEMVEVGEYANGNTKYARQCTGSDASLSENLAMLLQKGRSSGLRIVCAAQRPSTEIIPGDAKANFPVRVAFRLPKAVDSEVVLDEGGAEGLTDKGDGLIISPEYRETIRFQSYYKPKEVHA
ncbi:MAG TPA: DNA translocase FtsK [Puia sp.]|jgi:hypothetical protein|nr:DNA translocase FtsK [Puia sp.]